MPTPLFLAEYYLLWSLLAGVVLYLVRLEYREGSLAVLGWIALLMIYVLPSLGDPFVADGSVTGSTKIFRLIENPVLLKAHGFALAFCVCYLVARVWSRPAPQSLYRDAVTLKLSRVDGTFLALCAVAALLGLAAGVAAIYTTQGAAGITESGYSAYRLESDPLFLRPAIFLFSTVGGAVFIGWITRRWMPAAVVAVSTIMFFLLTFSRQNLMFMLVPFAWYLLYRYRSRSSRFALVLFGFCAYQFTVLLLLIRYYGSFLSAFDAFASGELFADFWFRLLSEGGEVELRLVYYFFVGGEYRSDVFPGQTYLRLLMLPLPAELSLGLKPGLTDINLFYLFFDEPVYSTVLGGSLHALVFGDSFVNFGWAGVAVGAFWGAAASAYQRLSAKLPVVLRIAMIAPLGFGAMMIARGSIYNSSAYIFWSFVLLCTMYVAAEIIGRLFGPARVDASAPRPA